MRAVTDLSPTPGVRKFTFVYFPEKLSKPVRAAPHQTCVFIVKIFLRVRKLHQNVFTGKTLLCAAQPRDRRPPGMGLWSCTPGTHFNNNSNRHVASTYFVAFCQ